MAVSCVAVASAQHRVGMQGAVVMKYGITDKFFLNQYAEYSHDFTNNRMNYWIAKPLGLGYDFTKWFTVDFGYYYFQFEDCGMHRPELSLIFTLRENNLQFQYQKRLTMDKKTGSDIMTGFTGHILPCPMISRIHVSHLLRRLSSI